MTTNPLYLVFRDEIDYHHDPSGGMRLSEIRGSYWSYEAAKAAAKQDLLNDWKRNFFDVYEEVEEGEETGLFQVNVECPEGEIMTVYVKKVDVPLLPSSSSEASTPDVSKGKGKAAIDSNRYTPSAKLTSTSTMLPEKIQQAKVYHVIRREIHWHLDPSGKTQGTRVRSTCWTYEEAVNMAKRDLTDDFRRETFVEYEEMEKGDTGHFEINARCNLGNEYRTYIEEGKMVVPPPGHLFSIPPINSIQNATPVSQTPQSTASIRSDTITDSSHQQVRNSAPVSQSTSHRYPLPPHTRQVHLPNEAYVIFRTDHVHPDDHDGNTSLATDEAYISVADANQRASWELDEIEGREDSDDEEWESPHERGEGHHGNCLFGHIRLYWDELDQVDVTVKKVKLSWPVMNDYLILLRMQQQETNPVATQVPRNEDSEERGEKRRKINAGQAEVVDLTGVD
ncbi:uncharacterized protein I206_101489 [Kwoniella pini CBS 10737]|uniref:Uncharacterized protein n=1 Tax=Kwoniella pini CBS 10737 TaxID=1296096 RepID=A0A1B9HWH8_9TREE|nr:uncharacterized protein I206_06538 [Kwoniella pini CBS 10737]OCF47635.1 hypothetical protein I206_06538 [Kwoniella pini CBS 10737]